MRVNFFASGSSSGIDGTSQIRILTFLREYKDRFKNFDFVVDDLNLLEGDILFIDRVGNRDMTDDFFTTLQNKIVELKITTVHFIDDDFTDSSRISAVSIRRYLELAESCDFAVFTTETLLSKAPGNYKKRFLLPISMSSTGKLKSPGVRRNRPGSPLKIGYMGTFTHRDDLELGLRELSKNSSALPRIDVEIVGGFTSLEALPLKDIFTFDHIIPPGMDHQRFTLWMQTNMDWDYFLVPLKSQKFNTFKSDIKIIDAAMLGCIPILIGEETPYSKFSWEEHGVMNWKQFISHSNSQDRVQEHRDGVKRLQIYVDQNRRTSNYFDWFSNFLNGLRMRKDL